LQILSKNEVLIHNMNAVIKAENLGKKYIIGHQRQPRYQTLRDTMTHTARGVWQRIRHPLSPNRESIDLEELWALKDINFEVQQGERVGIIGANGAGKSTLLKVLSRITEPTTGKVRIKGRVSSLLEVGTGFHPELTGRENVFLNGAILGMTRQEVKRKFDEIIAFAELEKFLDTPVKRYSSGMYVRLAFAVAAHLEPEILIVDEVLSVGDAAFQKKCLGKMQNVAGEGRTVLFVSHNMAAVQNLCDQCFLLEKGSITQSGESQKVVTHYLQKVLEPALVETNLADRKDRSGTGIIRLTGFHIEDGCGNRLAALQSGLDAVFVFSYCSNQLRSTIRNVDMGFSLHDTTNKTLSVLYSSYLNRTFTLTSKKGEIRCWIPSFPLAAGRYRIGARITVSGVEADWPRDGIGFFDVIEGDFYGTGKRGFGEGVLFLLKGEWKVTENSGRKIANETSENY